MIGKSETISLLLLNESLVCKGIDDYKYSLNWMKEILEDLRINQSKLTKLGRLCLCILTVGAGRTDLFLEVFKKMWDWEEVKGPFWIWQLELMRHATIHTIKQNIRDGCNNTEIMLIIDAMLPEKLPDYISNQKVRDKLSNLRGEINTLFSTQSTINQKSIEIYENQYPLDLFMSWFITQTTQIVKEYTNIHREEIGLQEQEMLLIALEAILKEEYENQAPEVPHSPGPKSQLISRFYRQTTLSTISSPKVPIVTPEITRKRKFTEQEFEYAEGVISTIENSAENFKAFNTIKNSAKEEIEDIMTQYIECIENDLKFAEFDRDVEDEYEVFTAITELVKKPTNLCGNIADFAMKVYDSAIEQFSPI